MIPRPAARDLVRVAAWAIIVLLVLKITSMSGYCGDGLTCATEANVYA